MVRDLCRFCKKFDDMMNLIDPCDCYKKFDALRVHQKCLQEHISDRTQRQLHRYNPLENPNHCQVCKKPYRVKLEWRFGTKRIWSAKSFHSYIEGFVIGGTCLMMLFSLYIVAVKEGQRGTVKYPREDFTVLLPIAILSVGMFALTVRKIYQRWKVNQMEADIVDVV
jgi:hypothetical protein